MNESELEQIERQFGFKLPEVYKKLMTNYPQDFKELGEPYNGASWLYLKLEMQDVLDANQIFRDGFEGEKFTKYMFVIGEDGCGGYFFISTNENSGKVYTINHETGDFDLYSKKEKDYDWTHPRMMAAKSLQDYENDVRNMLQSFEKDRLENEEE